VFLDQADSAEDNRSAEADRFPVVPSPSFQDGLPAFFERSTAWIHDLGKEFFPQEDRILELRERLIEERFHLAVLGQFKRGKSTLLNALLGEPILPTAVVPLTAIPTFLHFGEKRSVRIAFEDGREQECKGCPYDALLDLLEQHVTEEANPENRLEVVEVDVEHPAPLLRKGLVLIDTPGIGSTYRHNTEATVRFLSQCDAALFVVSTDPPITEAEIAFLKTVHNHVRRLFFILNKVDYLSPGEREESLTFLRKVLEKQAQLTSPPEIFPVSARDALQARVEKNPGQWKASGMETVESYLLGFLASEKTRTLQEALSRKAYSVLSDVHMKLQLQRRSLETPLELLDEKHRLFEEKVEEAEGLRLSAGDLLAGDRKRMVKLLEEQSGDLREKAQVHFRSVLQETLESARDRVGLENGAKAAIAESMPTFFEKELERMSRTMNERVQQLLRTHQRRANDLVETVRRVALELFDLPYEQLEREETLDKVRRPYWVTHHWSTRLSEIPSGLFDWLLPRTILLRRIQKRLLAEIGELLMHNVENLRWATLQNLDRTFRQFTSNLDQHMKQTVSTTRRAIEDAREQRLRGSGRVAPEIERLIRKESECLQLMQSLKSDPS